METVVVHKPPEETYLMTDKDDSKTILMKFQHLDTKLKAAYFLNIVFLMLTFSLVVALIFTSHRTPCAEIKNLKSASSEDQVKNSAPCEDDWIWYRGKCYFFSTERANWDTSERSCISHNASLALLNSQKELDFVLQVKDLSKHWIGLRRTDDNAAWTWTNGTLYNESLFSITRSSNRATERVYLNGIVVRSEEGSTECKYICTKP